MFFGVAGVAVLAIAALSEDRAEAHAAPRPPKTPSRDGAPPVRPPAPQRPEGMAGRHFAWSELVRSSAARRLGLANVLTPEARANLERLVAHVLDPVREALGRPVRITSGYRSSAVNQAVHGAAGSQHMLGEAADFKVDGVVAELLATAVARLGVPFDQLIWYAPERGGHVHVSFTAARQNRRQTLHAPAGGGYVAWRPRLDRST